MPNVAGASLVRAIVATSGDAEPRNDTLTTVLEVSPAAGAVLVSTSPDLDAREALALLRGALALPTRGFYRIAPGLWRQDGSLGPANESEIRKIVRDAPLVVLHGDTAVFGPPRAATKGALALFAPPPEGSADWYATWRTRVARVGGVVGGGVGQPSSARCGGRRPRRGLGRARDASRTPLRAPQRDRGP